MRSTFGKQFACALIAFVAATAVWLTPAPASAAVREFRMMTFNFCGAGSDCTNQTADHRATSNLGLKLNELSSQITQFQPDVVLLQEICELQFNTLVVQQLGTVWPMWGGTTVTKTRLNSTVLQGFGVQDMNSECIGSSGTPDEFGNAILVRNGVTLSDVQDLDINPGPTGYKPIICATLGDENSTRACSVHTNASNLTTNLRTIEAQNVAAIATAGPAVGHPVVVGGDFNIDYNDHSAATNLDSLYAQGGSGTFEEADQCGTRAANNQTNATGCNEWTKDRGSETNPNWTLDRKFDYLFLKREYYNARPGTSVVNSSLYSDHGIYKGFAIQCATATGNCA